MNKLLHDYVKTVADDESVTVRDAMVFIEGLEEYYMNEHTKELISVVYDTMNKDGYLQPHKNKFRTIQEAMEFIRELGTKAITQPIIEDVK